MEDLDLNYEHEFDNDKIDKLKDIFRLDSWSYSEALNYLIGYPVWYFDNIDDYRMSDGDHHYRLEQLRLARVWASGKHDERNHPQYYINWAIDKDVTIPWLEEALELKLCSDPNEIRPIESKLFHDRAMLILKVVKTYGKGNLAPSSKKEEIFEKCKKKDSKLFPKDCAIDGVFRKAWQQALDHKYIKSSDRKHGSKK